MALLSRSTQYAVAALTYLATQPVVKLTTAEEIALETRIPLPYLWKLLKRLADEGLIKSSKGSKGGYQLRRTARELTVGEIMGALGERTPSQFCVLAASRCSTEQFCPLHKSWERLWSRIDKITLAKVTTSGWVG